MSELEFENSFMNLQRFLRVKIKQIPRRLKVHLSDPFNDAISDMYEAIMTMADKVIIGKGETIDVYRAGLRALDDIRKINSCTYTYWSLANKKDKSGIRFYERNQRRNWASLVNKEVDLLINTMKNCKAYNENDVVIPYIIPFTNADIKRTQFTKELLNLNRTIMKRASHMNKHYRDIHMEMLVKLSRDALYNALDGNKKIPTTKKEYIYRKKRFNDVRDCLFKMNRPLKELAFDGIFSEKDLEKIANAMNNALHIGKSIQESDEIRFANLD